MLIALLAAYLLLLLVLTLWLRRGRGAAQDAQTYYVAGGRLSALTTACSLTATSVGGSSTVITAALVYRHGLAGVWIDLAGVLGYGLLALIAARIRETGVASIAEFAGLRHGPSVRRVVAALVVVVELGWLALLSKATAALLAPALPGVGEVWLLAAAVSVVVSYTLIGGQFVVSYSDVAQLALMAVGLWIVAPAQVLAALSARAISLSTLAWHFPTAPSLGWSQVGGFLLLTGLPHLVGSDVYAKVLSARDGKTAARGALFAAGLKLLFALAIAFIALGGRALYPALAQPAALLGTLVHQLLPPQLGAVVLVALAATMMSSADQVLLSAITMVDHDLLAGRVRAARWLTAAGGGGLAFLLAWAAPTVIDAMKVAYTVFAAGLALPVLATAIWPGRAFSRRWLIAALIAGASLGGGLHIARLAGFFTGQPIYWGLAVNALLLAFATFLPARNSC